MVRSPLQFTALPIPQLHTVMTQPMGTTTTLAPIASGKQEKTNREQPPQIVADQGHEDDEDKWKFPFFSRIQLNRKPNRLKIDLTICRQLRNNLRNVLLVSL